MQETITKPETGLDPADWNDVKTLGYQIIDDMVDYKCKNSTSIFDNRLTLKN